MNRFTLFFCALLSWSLTAPLAGTSPKSIVHIRGERVKAMAISPCGQFLYVYIDTHSRKYAIAKYNIASSELLWNVGLAGEKGGAFHLNADGTRLIVGTKDNSLLAIYNAETGKCRYSFAMWGYLAASNDDRFVIDCSKGNVSFGRSGKIRRMDFSLAAQNYNFLSLCDPSWETPYDADNWIDRATCVLTADNRYVITQELSGFPPILKWHILDAQTGRKLYTGDGNFRSIHPNPVHTNCFLTVSYDRKSVSCHLIVPENESACTVKELWTKELWFGNAGHWGTDWQWHPSGNYLISSSSTAVFLWSAHGTWIDHLMLTATFAQCEFINLMAVDHSRIALCFHNRDGAKIEFWNIVDLLKWSLLKRRHLTDSLKGCAARKILKSLLDGTINKPQNEEELEQLKNMLNLPTSLWRILEVILIIDQSSPTALGSDHP